MNSIVRNALAFATVALLLAACDTSPTDVTAVGDAARAPASARLERNVEEKLYDMTDSYMSARCGEDDTVELVRMEGAIYERLVWFQDGAGQYHITHHTMPVGLRGVGVDSGEEYRVAEREHATYNQLKSGFTGSYRQTLMMRGTTTGTRFYMVFRGHYVIDEENIVKVERDQLEIGCSAT
jgi:hypothetical protein